MKLLEELQPAIGPQVSFLSEKMFPRPMRLELAQIPICSLVWNFPQWTASEAEFETLKIILQQMQMPQQQQQQQQQQPQELKKHLFRCFLLL